MSDGVSHIGIVIDKEDPEKLGRVQVYVPDIDPPLTTLTRSGKTSFVFPGNDNNSSLTVSELNKLRKSCDWYYVQQPIFGGGAIGRLNEATGKTTVSNTATETNAFRFAGSNKGAVSNGVMYQFLGSVHDAFANPSESMTRNANYTGYDYCPRLYVNAPNGIFCLPEIGTKVIVTTSSGINVITGKLPMEREMNIMLDKS